MSICILYTYFCIQSTNIRLPDYFLLPLPFRTWARGPMGFFGVRPAFYEIPETCSKQRKSKTETFESILCSGHFRLVYSSRTPVEIGVSFLIPARISHPGPFPDLQLHLVSANLRYTLGRGRQRLLPQLPFSSGHRRILTGWLGHGWIRMASPHRAP